MNFEQVRNLFQKTQDEVPIFKAIMEGHKKGDVQEVFEKDVNAISPVFESLKETLKESRQQDVHETFVKLLELCPTLNEVFEYKFKLQTFKKCIEHESNNLDKPKVEDNSIKIAIPENSDKSQEYTVESLLCNFQKKEILSGVKCDTISCKNNCNTIGTIKFEIQQTTNILCIQIVRFRYYHHNGTERNIKLKNPIDIFEVLYFQGIYWHLKSISAHIGVSRETGHYVAYIKHEDGWYVADDSFVTKTPMPLETLKHNTPLKQRAYLLFYERESILHNQTSISKWFTEQRNYFHTYLATLENFWELIKDEYSVYAFTKFGVFRIRGVHIVNGNSENHTNERTDSIDISESNENTEFKNYPLLQEYWNVIGKCFQDKNIKNNYFKMLNTLENNL
jgi:hypothetical protein